MDLQIYTLEKDDEWDSIVRTFDNYDTYWLSGYVKAFKIHGDGEPLLFYYEDDKARGINVVMRRDISNDEHFSGCISKNELFDLSSPYGYGGWLIEGYSDKLFEEYELWCKTNNIVSEFVRFHPVLENHKFCENAYEIVPLGKTITIDLTSPEIIWANITSKNRNMIRKAQKNGVQIFRGQYPEIYKIFREIYNSTMDKDNADKYYYFDEQFYNSVLNDLPHNAQIFYAIYENKVIAASIMLVANRRMNYHLSGSVRGYSNLAPTNLILYEASLWGYENGCKTLYLGGGVGSGEDSLFKFKKAFYRLDDLNRFHIGKKVFDKDKYDKLVLIRDNIESDFFPKYRA